MPPALIVPAPRSRELVPNPICDDGNPGSVPSSLVASCIPGFASCIPGFASCIPGFASVQLLKILI